MALRHLHLSNTDADKSIKTHTVPHEEWDECGSMWSIHYASLFRYIKMDYLLFEVFVLEESFEVLPEKTQTQASFILISTVYDYAKTLIVN